MKIPFDIKYRPQIESGEYKVETRDGLHSVRIICWDAAGSQRDNDIIGLEKGTLGAENIQRYDVTGHLIADSSKRGNKDLVLIGGPFLKCGDKISHIVFPNTYYEIIDIYLNMDGDVVYKLKNIDTAVEFYKCAREVESWAVLCSPSDIGEILNSYEEDEKKNFNKTLEKWSESEKEKFNKIYSLLRQAADTHAYSTTCRLIGDKEAIELQDFLRDLTKMKKWHEKVN